MGIPLQPLLHSTVLLWIQCRIIVSLVTMATIITVCVILLFAQSSSSSSSSSSCPCSEPLFHCDEYEQRCLSCQDICEDQTKFADCNANCPQYLQTVIFQRTVQKDDLKTLTWMVALTAVMTCVGVMSMLMLIIMKMRKKRRLKKKILPTSVFTVDKGKVDIDMTKKNITSDSMVLKSETLPVQRHSLAHGTSMNTQLSQESSKSSINLPSTDTTTTGLTSSRRLSGRYGKTPRRLPSEDCIPEVGGRCNIAMSQVPGDQGGREYIAPHSQVV